MLLILAFCLIPIRSTGDPAVSREAHSGIISFPRMIIHIAEVLSVVWSLLIFAKHSLNGRFFRSHLSVEVFEVEDCCSTSLKQDGSRVKVVRKLYVPIRSERPSRSSCLI